MKVYAVIEDSGQQFRVNEGDVLLIDLRDLADGTKKIEFDRVLLVSADHRQKYIQVRITQIVA